MHLDVRSSLEVDATSRIEVSARGLSGAASGSGPVATYGGGSHGGVGGRGGSNAYGSYKAPRLPGSGGYGGRSGGGVVEVRVGDNGLVVLDGSLLANGATASATQGAGAGGSISVTTPRLVGQGTISAAGGNSINGGAGGGGRIAVVGLVEEPDLQGGMLAPGGSSSGGYTAGAGTVFIQRRDQQHGDLIIDNQGNSSSAATPLVTVPAGTLTSLGGNVVSNAALSMSPDFYVGAYIKPNVAANGTETLLDDPYFTVLGNDATTFTIDGDPTVVADVGDEYRGLFIFDNLEIRGGAQVQTTADILVLEGDRSSADTTTFHTTGGLQGTYLELVDGGRLLIEGALRRCCLVAAAAGTSAAPARCSSRT